MKIAILGIYIGEYWRFWQAFYLSSEKRLIPDIKKDYYIFSDKQDLLYAENENVHVIFQKNMGWPDNTLMRYQLFLSIEKELEKYDYIFFCNANLYISKLIGREILPSDDEKLFFVKRVPSFLCHEEQPYEKNILSTAYVAPGESELYVRGGFNGGQASHFIEMCHVLNDNILKDKREGIIALWHDESHITRYAIDHPESKILSPAYLYPEGYVMPYDKKILVRKKNNEEVRFGTKSPMRNIKRKIKLCMRNMVYWLLIHLHIIPYLHDL